MKIEQQQYIFFFWRRRCITQSVRNVIYVFPFMNIKIENIIINFPHACLPTTYSVKMENEEKYQCRYTYKYK